MINLEYDKKYFVPFLDTEEREVISVQSNFFLLYEDRLIFHTNADVNELKSDKKGSKYRKINSTNAVKKSECLSVAIVFNQNYIQWNVIVSLANGKFSIEFNDANHAKTYFGLLHRWLFGKDFNTCWDGNFS